MAISANQIKRFIPLLKAANSGIILHESLRGVRFDTSEDDGIRNGAEVTGVIPDMAAADAGLQPGDRITKVAGLAVPDTSRF